MQHPPTALMQAEAMAAYTRSLLEPLVAHVAELEGTIRDQAEMIGRQAAQLEAARAQISPRVASGATAPPDRTPQPFWTRSPRGWIAGAATVLAIVAAVVLVVSR